MLRVLLLSLLTFIANSVILTLYFSAIMRGEIEHLRFLGFGFKGTIYKDAFKITFPGTILGSILILLNPILPRFMPLGPFSSPIDVGVTVGAIIWVVLIRRYCKTDWWSAIFVTVPAVIIYTFMMLFISMLVLLLATFVFLP